MLLRKVGEAVERFRMIRDGDRVAVALSGGKDSLTMLEALILLSKRAPIDFSVCAFTVEQGKFLRPIEPLGDYLKSRGIDWTYFHDRPSFRLLPEDRGRSPVAARHLPRTRTGLPGSQTEYAFRYGKPESQPPARHPVSGFGNGPGRRRA